MKNYLYDYLTDECDGCLFWGDGTDDKGIGCDLPAPNIDCPFFAKVYQEGQSEQK